MYCHAVKLKLNIGAVTIIATCCTLAHHIVLISLCNICILHNEISTILGSQQLRCNHPVQQSDPCNINITGVYVYTVAILRLVELQV